MKIYYINQTGQLGGGELALLPWLEHTPQDAHVILLEDGPFRPLLEKAGIVVEVLALTTIKQVRRESGVSAIVRAVPALLALRGKLRRTIQPAEILYANSQKAFLLTALSKRSDQLLVWHLRDILTEDHFSSRMRKLAVAVGNRFASAIIANSQATADAYAAAGGNAAKVTIVHDGVDGKPFERTEDDLSFATNLRAHLGVAAGTPLIGVFGRLSEWKGQEVFLDAMATMPEAHAVLIGAPLFGEEAYAERLHQRASQSDLAGRVHFLGFRRDIPSLMKAMDIIVHTSIAPEPFGLVIVEGMLAERPVIATRAGGALEIIVDQESGLLTTPGDVSELRSAIEVLLQDKQRSLSLARKAKLRAETSFSLRVLFRGISQVLSTLPRHRS